MTTLNKIAASIADDFDKPFDTLFIERVKFSIMNLRAMFIREEYERTGGDASITQTLVMPVMAQSNDDCNVIDGCNLYVADLSDYRPITLKLGGPIFFAVLAQSNDRPAFQHATLAEMRYASLRCIEDLRYYYYANGKVYFYNWPKLAKSAMFSAYWEDPKAVAEACANSTCIGDDDPMDIGAHMIERIVNTIKTSLRNAPKTEVEHS